MSRIEGIADLSRFVRDVDRVTLNNNVKLVVGETMFDVNGYIISQTSAKLEELVCAGSEIFLDGFLGQEDSVKEIVQMLYGATVELSEKNVKPIIKFGTIYEVHGLVKAGLAWLKDYISADNLLDLVEFGDLIETVGSGRREVLDLCRDFVARTVKDDFSEISGGWSFRENINLVKFLLQNEILYFTLPVLLAWVDKEADVKFVLDKVESKGLMLSSHGIRSAELLQKMSNKTEMLETSKRINNLSATAIGEGASCSKSGPDLISLLGENFVAFPLEKILQIEKHYRLEHIEYALIIYRWILNRKPTEQVFNIVWNSIRQSELSLDFMKGIGSYVLSTKIDGTPTAAYTPDAASIKDIDEYQLFDSEVYVHDALSSQQRQKLYTHLNRSAKTFIFSADTANHVPQLLDGKTATLCNVACKGCGIEHDVSMRLFKPYSDDPHIQVQMIIIHCFADLDKCPPRSVALSSTTIQIARGFKRLLNKFEAAKTSGNSVVGLSFVYKCKTQPSKKRKLGDN